MTEKNVGLIHGTASLR